MMLFAKVVSIVIINNRFHILQNVLEVSYVVFFNIVFQSKNRILNNLYYKITKVMQSNFLKFVCKMYLIVHGIIMWICFHSVFSVPFLSVTYITK